MIFKCIKDSCNNFFENILGLKLHDCKKRDFKNLLCSKIEIEQNGNSNRVFLFFKKETLNLIGYHLLFEKNLNIKDREDLINEVANLIVGTAKTMLEDVDKQSTYRISTPIYLGNINNIDTLKLDEKASFKINNRCFVLGIEE